MNNKFVSSCYIKVEHSNSNHRTTDCLSSHLTILNSKTLLPFFSLNGKKLEVEHPVVNKNFQEKHFKASFKSLWWHLKKLNGAKNSFECFYSFFFLRVVNLLHKCFPKSTETSLDLQLALTVPFRAFRMLQNHSDDLNVACNAPFLNQALPVSV